MFFMPSLTTLGLFAVDFQSTKGVGQLKGNATHNNQESGERMRLKPEN